MNVHTDKNIVGGELFHILHAKLKPGLRNMPMCYKRYSMYVCIH